EQTALVIEGLRERQCRRVILAINKIDEVRRESLLALAPELAAAYPFERVFMISALTGDGVEDLVAWLAKEAPEGPWLYPEDASYARPLRLLAAEISRETLFIHHQEELP